MKVKEEPVDPLQMEMDEEIEYEPDAINKEVGQIAWISRLLENAYHIIDGRSYGRHNRFRRHS